MKKWLCGFLVIFIFASVQAAKTEGLFPDMDQLFGTAMPSFGLSVGHEPSEIIENEEGLQEIFSDVSDEEYRSFGMYLGAMEAKVSDLSVDVNSIKATVVVYNESMLVEYNWTDKKVIITYTPGTRVETKKKDLPLENNIFPPVGGIMPSAEFATGKKPSSQVADADGMTQVYSSFDDSDYTQFSSYLGFAGAILKASSVNDGILSAEIELYCHTFFVLYNWNTNYLEVFYPKGTMPEKEKWNILQEKGAILPSIDSFGLELPHMSNALQRDADLTEQLTDGAIQETYLNFTNEDYNLFSKYLQEKNCSVISYTQENGTLVIELGNGSGTFTFIYDSVRHTGKTIYNGHSRVESAWIPGSPVFAGSNPGQSTSQSIEKRQKLCEKIFQEVCEFGMKTCKTGNYSAFVSEFGDPFLSDAKYYFNNDTDQFYVHMKVVYGGVATTELNFYFELIGDDDFSQLDAPSDTVAENEWIQVYAHTEKECYDMAISYFNNLRWKDPSSITIHSHNTAYGMESYTFYIDYSGKNGFGGVSRETYIIEVDASSNKVISSFSY